MAYKHTRPIIPHSRESYTRLGDKFIRIGSWGSLPKECKTIELYRAGGGPCGPYTIDHVPDSKGGIWKIFYMNDFMRYADEEDVYTMMRLVRAGVEMDIHEFVTLPRIHIGSSTGRYEALNGDDLDEAFGGVAPHPAKTLSLDGAFGEDDLDEAFASPGVMRAVPPKRSAEDDDPFGGAFEAAPKKRPRTPKRKGSTLAEWSEIIMQSGREQGCVGVGDGCDPFDPYGDDLDEAFS